MGYYSEKMPQNSYAYKYDKMLADEAEERKWEEFQYNRYIEREDKLLDRKEDFEREMLILKLKTLEEIFTPLSNSIQSLANAISEK